MKKTVLKVILILTPLAFLWAQRPPVNDGKPAISVTGEAVVHTKPDKIVIRLGIETWDTGISVAKQQNSEILKKAIAGFKECGVPEKAIQTDQLSIQPEWADGVRRQKFIGYFVRNTLVVTLSDVEMIDALVTAALDAGVNYIHGIDFQTTGFKKYREQARELALKAAMEKAEKMAAVLGRSVGPPIQVNEYGGGQGFYWSSWGGWGGGSGRSSGMSQVQVQADSGGSGEASESLALGQMSIRANVSVTFELRAKAAASGSPAKQPR